MHEELAELLFLDEVLLDILLNFVEDNLLDFFDIFSVLLDLFAESFLSDEVSANTPARIKQIKKIIPSFLNDFQSLVLRHLKIK